MERIMRFLKRLDLFVVANCLVVFCFLPMRQA